MRQGVPCRSQLSQAIAAMLYFPACATVIDVIGVYVRKRLILSEPTGRMGRRRGRMGSDGGRFGGVVRRGCAFGWRSVLFAVILAILTAGATARVAAAQAQANAKEQFAAAYIVEAKRLAQKPGIHPRMIDAFLIERGFTAVPSDFISRAIMGWTLRRPFQLIYFDADGTGRFRSYPAGQQQGWLRNFTWWRTPDGVCLDLEIQGNRPSRICFQFYRYESLQIAFLINPPGLVVGPTAVSFLKGDRTGEERWAAAAVMD